MVPEFEPQDRTPGEIMKAAGMLKAPDVSTVGPERKSAAPPYNGWLHIPAIEQLNEYRWLWTITSEYLKEGRFVRRSRLCSPVFPSQDIAETALDVALSSIVTSRGGNIVDR